MYAWPLPYWLCTWSVCSDRSWPNGFALVRLWLRLLTPRLPGVPGPTRCRDCYLEKKSRVHSFIYLLHLKLWFLFLTDLSDKWHRRAVLTDSRQVHTATRIITFVPQGSLPRVIGCGTLETIPLRVRSLRTVLKTSISVCYRQLASASWCWLVPKNNKEKQRKNRKTNKENTEQQRKDSM